MDTSSVNIIRIRIETRQRIDGVRCNSGILFTFIFLFVFDYGAQFLLLPQFVSLVFCFEECWIDSNSGSQRLEKNQYTLFDRKLKHKKNQYIQYFSMWFPWFLLLRYWYMLPLEEKNKQKKWRQLNTTKLLVP